MTPTSHEWAYRMCQPCSEVRHDECMGAEQWCECFVELLFEAEMEELTDEAP